MRSPDDCWGRAGLHTNDELVSWNGTPLQTMAEFSRALRQSRFGDSITVVVRRDGAERTAHVIVGAQVDTKATITTDSNATSAQRAHRAAWFAAK